VGIFDLYLYILFYKPGNSNTGNGKENKHYYKQQVSGQSQKFMGNIH